MTESVLKILEHDLIDTNKPCKFESYSDGDFHYILEATQTGYYFFIVFQPVDINELLLSKESISQLLGINCTYFNVKLLDSKEMTIEQVYDYSPKQFNYNLN